MVLGFRFPAHAHDLWVGVMLVLLCLGAGLSHSAPKPVGGWSVSVIPAWREGEPSVAFSPGPDAVEATATVAIVEATRSTSVTLVESLQPDEETSVSLERGDSETFVEVSLTTGTSGRAAFRWRTLVMPEGADPFEYGGLRGYEAPPDYDAFWEKAKSELAAVPMRPLVRRVPEKDTTSGLLYRVDLPTVEETTVVAWLFVPRAAYGPDGAVRTRFPAVFSAPGYGAQQTPSDRTADGLVTMAFNPRSHGPSRDYWKCPVDHLAWRIGEPDRYYYRQAVLDCLRGMEYLMSRPEVDPARVGTEGGSQGGFFAIAVGALEPRVAAVASNVTSWAGFADREVLALAGTQMRVNKLIAGAGDGADAIRRSLALLDGANFASRLRCPTQILMGDVDTLCPWACGLVTFNRIPPGVEKEFRVMENTGHEVTAPMRAANRAWMAKHLRVAKPGVVETAGVR